MTRLLRNVVAFGCFVGLAMANGCAAQPGGEGNDQQQQDAVETPVGEAQQASSGYYSQDACNLGGPLDEYSNYCAALLCDPWIFPNSTCCTVAWDISCVSLALSLCNTSCYCPHDPCTTGDRLDAGCPGRRFDENLPAPAVAQVCSTPGLSYCCTKKWDSGCVEAYEASFGTANCGSSVGGLPPGGGDPPGGGLPPGGGGGDGDSDGHGNGHGH